MAGRASIHRPHAASLHDSRFSAILLLHVAIMARLANSLVRCQPCASTKHTTVLRLTLICLAANEAQFNALVSLLQDAVHYAYFAPYTLDDHMALVSELQSDDRVRLRVLGESLDGHDIDMLQIGDSPTW